MAKQPKSRPNKKEPPHKIVVPVQDANLGLTKNGNPRKPWHLNGIKSSRGKGFDKQPQNCGRKKKIYTILKEKGYDKADITTAFGEMAFYSLNELSVAEKNGRMPIITRIVAKQFRLAFSDGDWSLIKEIMEHTIGKPIQAVHTTNDDIEISFED